jgi:hypothetical protein
MGLGNQGFSPEIIEHPGIIDRPLFKRLRKMGEDLGPEKRPGHGPFFPFNAKAFIQVLFIGIFFIS